MNLLIRVLVVHESLRKLCMCVKAMYYTYRFELFKVISTCVHTHILGNITTVKTNCALPKRNINLAVKMVQQSKYDLLQISLINQLFLKLKRNFFCKSIIQQLKKKKSKG